MDINQEEWEARLGSNLSRVCRLCLKTCEIVHPIFAPDRSNSHTLSHKIMSCAQVKVFEGDGLPTHVCNSCYGQVERSYQFKILCERSDNKLRGSTVSISDGANEDMDDSDDVDMMQLTPEVIIDEGPSTEQQSQQDEGREDSTRRDIYSRIMHSSLSKADTAALLTKTPQSWTEKKRTPVYLNGIPGFVHSNQEMAKLAVAMALQQRNLEEQERKASEKRKHLQMELQMRQRRSAESALATSPVAANPKAQRCRNGVKAFKCTQCSKSYSYSSALSRHKAVHNPQLRPHFCTLCNKGFTQIEKLIRHRRSHSVDSDGLFKEMAFNARSPGYYLAGLPHPSMIAQMTSSDVDKRCRGPDRQSDRSINLPSARPESIEISIKPDIYPYSDFEDDEGAEDTEQDLGHGDWPTDLSANRYETSVIKTDPYESDEVEIKEEPLESAEISNEDISQKSLKQEVLNNKSLMYGGSNQDKPDPNSRDTSSKRRSLPELIPRPLTSARKLSDIKRADIGLRPNIKQDSREDVVKAEVIEPQDRVVGNDIKRESEECRDKLCARGDSDDDEVVSAANDDVSAANDDVVSAANDAAAINDKEIGKDDQARINLFLRYQFMK